MIGMDQGSHLGLTGEGNFSRPELILVQAKDVKKWGPCLGEGSLHSSAQALHVAATFDLGSDHRGEAFICYFHIEP